MQADPNSAEAHSNLGNALEKMPGRLADAIAEYQAAVRFNPNSAEAHYNLGVALAKTEDRITRSDRTVRRGAAAESRLRRRRRTILGWRIRSYRGRLPDAIEHFEAALRIRPDFADAHYNLGIALSNTPGGCPMRFDEFEESLRIKPDPEVQQALDRLRVAQQRR